MLKRMGFKASVPALFPGGRRSLSEVASNFPFANEGEGLNGVMVESTVVISSSERIPNTGPWGKLRIAMASPKQSLAFPRHEVDVLENLKTSLPSTIGDDDFAELGPAVSGGADSGFDLAKEKPKDKGPPGILLDNGSQQATKTSHRQDSPVKLNFTKTPLEQDKYRPGTHFDLEGQSGALKSKTEAAQQKHSAENNQNHTGSLFISIDNIPPNISLLDLREAVSVYGEILSSSMRAGLDGLTSCHIKFKSLESKARALAAKWITVKNFQLPVRGFLYSLDYVTIRITNISMETAEATIHSMCTSYGCVSGLARTKEGAVDVVFRVEDSSVSQSIVKHLNDVCIDDSRWSAQLLPKLDHHSMVNMSDSQWPVESEISSLFGSFRKQFHMQRIYLEDLEDLHHAVLHLRDRPPDLHCSDQNSSIS